MLRIAVWRALGPAEGLAAARQAFPSATQSASSLLRFFSTSEGAEGSGASEAAPESAGSSSGSGQGRPSRLQSKQWRNWIDTKLDSKLEDLDQQQQQAAGAAAAPAAQEPPKRRAKLAKGFELEQQIYSIVAPARPTEDATLPQGVTSYGQLAMASDAPRFLRAAANVADISPQRLHPTRLFFPRSHYAPADLDPYKTSAAAAAGALDARAAPVATPDEVTRLADYKNAPLLASFLSDAGKLPLRQRTQLRAKLHRHLARQVKIARQLGILSAVEKWRPEAAAAGAEPQPRQQQQRRGAQQQQQQQQQQKRPQQKQQKQKQQA